MSNKTSKFTAGKKGLMIFCIDSPYYDKIDWSDGKKKKVKKIKKSI